MSARLDIVPIRHEFRLEMPQKVLWAPLRGLWGAGIKGAPRSK
jgi:hypothetical protein